MERSGCDECRMGGAAAPADHAGSAVRREPRRHGVAGVVRYVPALRSGAAARRPARAEREGTADEKRIPKPPESPEWREIRDKALEALGKSKDLRLLAHLGTALLRTDGVPAFAETLNVASHWLETYWSQTYPLVDEDAILRRNALNCFADPMAVVDALRRVPLVSSRQHGTFSLRDIDIATGQVMPATATPGRTKSRSTPRLRRCRSTSSTQLHESVVGAVAVAEEDRREDARSGRLRSDARASIRCRRSSTRWVRRCACQLASHPDAGRRPAPRCDARQRCRRRRLDGRRRQVAAGRHPGAGRGGGLLPAHGAVEPDPAVPRAREASGVEGFSRSAGRHRSGRASRRRGRQAG